MIPAYYFPSITLGSFTLPVYELAHSLAYLIAGIVLLSEAKRRNADVTIVYRTIIIGMAGAIIGARIGGVLSNFDYFYNHPEQIVDFGVGGWTESGGFLLSTVLMVAYLRSVHASVLGFFDMAAPCLALRFAISRIGCSAIHDHIGKVMEREWPWGVWYEGLLRHETGVYSLVANSIIFLVLWRLRMKFRIEGMLFVTYLYLYSISIFVIRFFRAEDLPYVSDERYAGLTATQYIALGVLLFAIFLHRRLLRTQTT